MHLTLEERYYIEIELKKGITQTEIAEALDRNQSVISKEIARNSGQRGYRHKLAHNKAQQRHKNKTKAVKLVPELTVKIDVYLKEDWSPEQISGRMKTNNEGSISHQSIYNYVKQDKCSGGMLHKHLRCQKTYRKRYGSKHNRIGIPGRVDIDARPQAANDRKRIGDLEADTIIGKNQRGAILTLDDRKSKLRLAAALPNKKATSTADAIINLLKPIKRFVHTITFDNSKEFSEHTRVAESLSCSTYFAKPYHSWERGQNENANGLLRQYFPKTMELIRIQQRQVLEAVHKLNRRPRKCLQYKTPI